MSETTNTENNTTENQNINVEVEPIKEVQSKFNWKKFGLYAAGTIAVGACAISGGPFIGLPESGDGAASVVPADLHVPGCPPHPLTILDGLLRLIGRIEEGRR